MRKFLILVLTLFLTVNSLMAQIDVSKIGETTFRYKYNLGDLFRYEGFIYQEVSHNGKNLEKSEANTTVSAKVVAVDGEWATLENSYRQFVKNNQKLSRLSLLEDSRFQQNTRGIYKIDPRYLFPAVRSIPSFPEKALHIGDKWQSQGEEKFDLSFLGAGRVATILKVNYQYEGMAKKEGKEFHKISLNYSPSIDKNNVSVRGTVKQIIYWDNEKGNIAFYDDEYEFRFITGGNTYTYKGISNGKRVDTPSENEQEKSWESQISESFIQEGLEDIKMIREKDGLKIILEDIYFEPNSGYLDERETQKLAKLADILKKIPFYTLLIEGHTANFGTKQEQIELSDERAFRVGEFLERNGVKTQSPLLFKGWGSEKPASKDNTPEAQKTNRRVEITLLEN